MSKQYKALKPVGPWAIGETIGVLPKLQIIQLLNEGVIEEVKDSENPETEIKPVQKKVGLGEKGNG